MKYLKKITSAHISPEYLDKVDSYMVKLIEDNLQQLKNINLKNRAILLDSADEVLIAINNIKESVANLGEKKGYFDYSVWIDRLRNKVEKMKTILEDDIITSDIEEYRELAASSISLFDRLKTAILSIERD